MRREGERKREGDALLSESRQHGHLQYDASTKPRLTYSVPIFFTDAPKHFATVAELVHLVSQFLQDKKSVLSAATVNHKWRSALLWDHYEADRKRLPKAAYKMQYAAEPDFRDYDKGMVVPFTVLSHVSWWFMAFILFVLMIVWARSTSAGYEVQTNVWIALLIVSGILSGIAALMGFFGVLYSGTGVMLADYVFRGLLCFLIVLFCALTTVGSDLSKVFHDGGNSAALSDDHAWPSDSTLAVDITRVQINDPSGWKQIQDYNFLALEKVSVCIEFEECPENDDDDDDDDTTTTGGGGGGGDDYGDGGDGDGGDGGGDARKMEVQAASNPQTTTGSGSCCAASKIFDQILTLSQSQWQHQGPFTSGSSSGGCTSPVQDAYPKRSLILDMPYAQQQENMTLLTTTDVLLSPPPPAPYGVEEIHLVLLGASALAKLPPASILAAAKWRSILLYDTNSSSSSSSLKPTPTRNDAELAEQCSEAGLSKCARMTPGDLANTLRALPFNLTETYIQNVVLADKTEIQLRYWLSRVTGATDAAAKIFAQPSTVSPKTFAGDNLEVQEQIDHVEWNRYWLSLEGEQVVLPRVLPYPGKCVYPTLSQSTTADHTAVSPTTTSRGGWVYTGQKSFWFQGRAFFHGTTDYFSNFPNVPIIGGTYALPSWCKGKLNADLFYASSIIMFFLPGALQIYALCYPNLARRRYNNRRRVVVDFKDAAGLWWRLRLANRGQRR